MEEKNEYFKIKRKKKIKLNVVNEFTSCKQGVNNVHLSTDRGIRKTFFEFFLHK